MRLLDHFSAEVLNRGVVHNQDFRDAFPGESDDDLQNVRKKFLGKAFERRQELLIRHLLSAGCLAEELVQFSLRDLLASSLSIEGERLRNLNVLAWRRIFSARLEADLWFVQPRRREYSAGGRRVAEPLAEDRR